MTGAVEASRAATSMSNESPAESTSAIIAASVRAAARGRHRRTTVVRLVQIALLAAFLGGWEWAARSGLLHNDVLYFGSPSGVGQLLWHQRSDLWTNLLSTLKAAGAGFALGSAAAILVGIAFAQLRLLDRIFDPFMVVLAGLPRIALAPLFVLWFGITDGAKIALSISLVFFVVLFNVRAGIQGVDRDLTVMAQSFGANRRQLFAKVIMPATVPVLFAGFRLGIVFSILGVIASEMTAARAGLGMQIVAYSTNLQPDGVFAVLTILAAVMAIVNAILRIIERRLLRWMPS